MQFNQLLMGLWGVLSLQLRPALHLTRVAAPTVGVAGQAGFVPAVEAVNQRGFRRRSHGPEYSHLDGAAATRDVRSAKLLGAQGA